MYAKCGAMVDARRVFDKIHRPNVVSWTALISGYAENGSGLVALDLFSRMKARGHLPDCVAYVAALKACTTLALSGSSKRDCLERGREIHSEIGGHLDHYVENALIDMYSNCGSMAEAHRVFDTIQKPDEVPWTSLVLGYAENGEGHVALGLFSRMKTECEPTSIAYVAALKACTSLSVNGSGKEDCLEWGRQIHSEVGCHLNHFVENALVDMYAKGGSMPDARSVFDQMQSPDVISWNALLMGYVDNGEGHVALDLLSKMRCRRTPVTYVAALKACALVGALNVGRKFHTEISEFTAHVVTCLVHFYAKCGSMLEAREVFDRHPRERDVSTWTALLSGYASFGETAAVFSLFEAMQDAGLRPNAVTCVCLLLCCSHAGLVEKARLYFHAMPVQYGVTPSVVHYGCMVDVLGRANQLNEAIAVIRRMPCEPTAVTWLTLMAACRKWKNAELGKTAFQSLVFMPQCRGRKDGPAHILMSHIHKDMQESSGGACAMAELGSLV